MKQDDRQLIRSKVMQSIDMSGDIGDEQVSDMIGGFSNLSPGMC